MVAILSASLISALYTHFYEYRYAQNVSELYKDDSHLFSCYVISDDVPTQGLFFVNISHIDGKALKRSFNAECYNSSGNYFDKGTYLNIKARLDTIEFGKSEYSPWLYGKGVYTKVVQIEDIVPDTSKSVTDVPYAVKGFFEKRMLGVMKNIPEKSRFERAFSISNAMMFGDKGLLDDTLTDNFRKSGLIHILCVSGLHFSVILGGLSFLMRWLVRSRLIRHIILVVAVIFYISVCGFARSAIRAAVMALVSAFGLAEIKTDRGPYNLLFAAGSICIFDPGAIMDGGFIMSCICCTGMICSYYISESICNRLKVRPVFNFIILAFTASFSASVFLLPYSLVVFDGASTVSVLASTMAVLPAEILLVLCWAASFFAGFGVDAVNFIFASAITFLSDFVCGVAEFFASLRFSYINADLPDISFLIFMITLAVAAVVSNSKSRAATVYLYIGSAITAVVTILLVA